MELGDIVTISDNAPMFCKCRGVIVKQDGNRAFGSEIVAWYLVEIELALTPWVTRIYSWPEPWLKLVEQKTACPMVLP